jgi:hypothetical protein
MNRIDFFYDGQLRRFMAQVVRAFSGFQYETGLLADGSREQRVVPCRMASQNKQVGIIMRNNSENSILAVPMITVFIKELEADRTRTQAPGFVGSVQVHERAVDPETGEYTGEPGNSYTVDRMMPHPLTATIQVDVWTSNELQKHQLFEQIFMAFNVGFDIQSSDNPLDWSALSTLSLDNMTWTSRAIPVGTSDEIDVLTFVFKLPMWISPPAKVKQQKLIHQIITNVLDGEIGPDDSIDGRAFAPSGNPIAQSIVTPGNYQISIDGAEITLIGQHERDDPSWAELLAQYGTLTPALSQLRLRADVDQSTDLDVVGTIQLDPRRKNVLHWQVDIDTVPSNTQKPVDAIIDPLRHLPGKELPQASAGQRYLIIEDIGPSLAWGDVHARANDIIEYNALTGWVVVFDSSATNSINYVVNLRSGKQLRFVDGSWIMSIDGTYNPGFWRILL